MQVQAKPSLLQGYIDRIVTGISRQNLGFILMTLSQIIWPLSFLFSADHALNPVETNLVRGFITMVSHTLIMGEMGISQDIRSTNNLKYILIRCGIISIHQFAITGMVFILPFPIVFTLNTACVLSIFPIDYFIFGVSINHKQIIGVICGFLGVLLTINGQFFLDLFDPSFQKQTDFKNYVTDDPYLKLLASIAFVVLNCCRGYALVITKKITGITGIQLSFHIGWSLLFLSSIAYPYAVQHQSSLIDLSWSVLWVGIPQNIVQILFLSAQVLSKNTGILNMISFLSIAISYIISLGRYNENVNPFCFAGVLFILYGIVTAIRNKQIK